MQRSESENTTLTPQESWRTIHESMDRARSSMYVAGSATIMLFWAAIAAVGTGSQYAIMTLAPEFADRSPWIFGVLWGVLMVPGMVGSAFIGRRAGRKIAPGDAARRAGIRVFLYWLAVVVAIFLIPAAAGMWNAEDAFLPLGTEFWDRDHLRYTVFFDPGRVKQGLELNERLGRPLREGETYTLVVDPTWPDAEGNPLQAPFEKRFTVGPADTTPLDTASWRLRVPASGSTQRLVISIPEPLDHALMRRAIGVEDEAGRRVDGEVEIGNWETRWTLTPSRPWVAGAHSLVVLSILEDLAGNKIGTPFEIDVFEQVDETTTDEQFRIPFEIR